MFFAIWWGIPLDYGASWYLKRETPVASLVFFFTIFARPVPEKLVPPTAAPSS